MPLLNLILKGLQIWQLARGLSKAAQYGRKVLGPSQKVGTVSDIPTNGENVVASGGSSTPSPSGATFTAWANRLKPLVILLLGVAGTYFGIDFLGLGESYFCGD